MPEGSRTNEPASHPSRLPLHELGLREAAHVVAVASPHAAEWAAWLAEIGFLPGEPVQVLAYGVLGGDPLVVRIGDSTFALRRAEAACVQVTPSPPGRSERGVP
ncbi:MAG: ferrous iron transport protein A [Burkholderiales bacterium]|nr:ferrous iron transport protein A [Burkholderiales bacterium]